MTARLVETPEGIGLVDDDSPELSPLVLSFTAPRRLGDDDDLVRALGLRKGTRTVVDATAGLGRDAIAIAATGANVVACERAPLVLALWADALARARPARVTLVAEDAVSYLGRVAGTAHAPDAVYLDPMYPQTERKAMQQRELRLLRAAMAGVDDDVDALIAAALGAARQRVVIKRPRKAPVSVPPPSHTWAGTSTRFDLYLVQRPTVPRD